MEINELLSESTSNFKNLQADAARLAEKWTQSGLLEGYSNEIEKNNMAMILENQAKQIVAEQSSTNTSTQRAVAGGGENWAGVALPLVRKVFAQIAAKDFVSVQPMNLPSGLVFYLDFKYGSNDGAAFSSGENMYGNVSTANSKMAVDTEVAGGLYGVGRFGYSVSSSLLTIADGNLVTGVPASGKVGTASINIATDEHLYGYDRDFSASMIAAGSGSAAGPSALVKLDILGASFTDLDTDAVRAIEVSSPTGTDIVEQFPQYSTYNPVSDVVSLIISTGSALNADTVFNFRYHKQPKDNTRGDFEDVNAPSAGAVSNLEIPEINVELASEAIVAKTRKLKAQWTPEFAQDLNAYHSIDAEAELTSLLSEYISMEIDLEILDMLIAGAVTTERWSAQSNRVWSGATTTGNWVVNAAGSEGGYYNSQGEWFQTLGTKIQKVSNKIHQKTLRGGANFLVCSPTVATILESIPGFAANTDGDKMDFAFGVQKVGQLNGRYKVYKNPYMTENLILTGYRGSQFLETGAVYAPYIPLMMTPLVYDPKSFTPRKGIMTRYAKKMIRPEFYGKIFISDLTTI